MVTRFLKAVIGTSIGLMALYVILYVQWGYYNFISGVIYVGIFYLPIGCVIVFSSGELFSNILSRVNNFFLKKQVLYVSRAIILLLIIFPMNGPDYGLFYSFSWVICYIFTMSLYSLLRRISFRSVP